MRSTGIQLLFAPYHFEHFVLEFLPFVLQEQGKSQNNIAVGTLPSPVGLCCPPQRNYEAVSQQANKHDALFLYVNVHGQGERTIAGRPPIDCAVD